MANASKSPGLSGPPKEMPYEEALQKLESIVEAMESGDLPLEALLTKFEEGDRLVKACQTHLDAAELKISKLEKNAAGEPVLKPADDLRDHE